MKGLTGEDVRAGIYCLLNIVNGNRYIGQAVDLQARKYDHFCSLRKSRHRNSHLQRAYEKYGEGSFLFKILEFCYKDNLTEREQFWIDKYGFQNLYNQAPATKSRLGLPTSNETRAKLSLALKAHHQSHPMSLETRHKIGSGNRGKPNPRRGLPGPPCPPKLKEYFRKLALGRKHSLETKLKLSIFFKGKPLSASHRAKIADALRGRKRCHYKIASK